MLTAVCSASAYPVWLSCEISLFGMASEWSNQNAELKFLDPVPTGFVSAILSAGDRGEDYPE
jgi:hypothetical protein